MTPIVQTIPDALPAALCQRWLSAIEQHAAAAGGAALRLADIASIDLPQALRHIASAPVGRLIQQRLGPAPWCNIDQCWVRRQHPPATRPPGEHPHSWHQDGALGHDFSLPAEADGGLLTMATLWLALQPCGDEAPSLEWSAVSPPELIEPHALARHAVQTQHARLQAGDALLFCGAVLHRTYVHAAMTRPRTSLEFRFFTEPAPRLAQQGWRPWPAA